MISHLNIPDIFRRKKIFQNTRKHRISSTIDVDTYVVIDVKIMYIIPFFNMTLSLKNVLLYFKKESITTLHFSESFTTTNLGYIH